MRKYLVLISLFIVVVAGCRVESNIILEIEEDGSALVGAEIGFDEEFRQLISENGADPTDIFGDLPTFGDDIVVIERTEGDMTFVGATSTVPDLSAFAEDSAALETFSTFSYEFDDASAELRATVSAADAADIGGDFGDLGFDPSQLTDEFFSANVVVSMPGEVTEHNADVVRQDGTLVWKIPFTGTKEITATSTYGTSTANWVLIILFALLVVGVIAVIAATVLSRRQQSQKAVDAAAASHTAASTAAETAVLADADGAVAATVVTTESAEPAPDTSPETADPPSTDDEPSGAGDGAGDEGDHPEST
jgi:hypothetical protein